MKRKLRKFWKEWGMAGDELLWFLLIPAFSLLIFVFTLIVLVLL